ncbi:MAG TPA: Clp1/GlmU family protein [Sedimentisphaerales bacterium]|nr:Clp1/GlmU family protein [Sedimentisphaerales bacterium]
MSLSWADKIAAKLSSRGIMHQGICLVLGGADTGKTTLVEAMAKHAAASRPVAIVDADIGQSHIGPPTTVGWAVIDSPEADFSALPVKGISFVGDVTPVGHLLQLSAAIVQCVQQASKAVELIIIDTPGLVLGPAAAALWWTVQRILQPELILAVQRDGELTAIIAGLRLLAHRLELIKSPPQIALKSPERRRNYRQDRFRKYFQDSCLYNISLSKVAVQAGSNVNHCSFVGRLAGLRDGNGVDLSVGLITQWDSGRGAVAVKAPQVDIEQIHCLVIGDVTTDIAG